MTSARLNDQCRDFHYQLFVCAAHNRLNSHLALFGLIAWHCAGLTVTLHIVFRALSLSHCTVCSLYWNGPATAHFHITGGGDFIDLLQKAGVLPITHASSFPASLAVKKRWFVVLTPTVLYIALKQDAVPPDNEHSPPEHKQQFYCAPVWEPPNQCFANHPQEACKHRSMLCSQYIYGHTGTLIQMHKENRAYAEDQ